MNNDQVENKQDLYNENIENQNYQSELPQYKSSTKTKITMLVFGVLFIILLISISFIGKFLRGNNDEIATKNSLVDVAKKVESIEKATSGGNIETLAQSEESSKDDFQSFEDLLKSRGDNSSLSNNNFNGNSNFNNNDSSNDNNKTIPSFFSVNSVIQNNSSEFRIIKGDGKVVFSSQEVAIQSPQTNTQNTMNTNYTIPNAHNNEQVEQSSSGNDYQGDVFTPTTAVRSKLNPNLTLPKGTYIECSLKTRLISTIDGGIACVVSNDVYSENGNVLLFEKGSVVTGMFKAGQMDDGMNRMFVIWQEIKTPNNIVIPVYSGASDTLGSSGIEGWIDHHYLERFGSSILLSLIDDSLNILANKTTQVGFTSVQENTKTISAVALEKMIDIKPTLYKNQGDLVGIYVNRDIDFSQVYELRRKSKVIK